MATVCGYLLVLLACILAKGVSTETYQGPSELNTTLKFDPEDGLYIQEGTTQVFTVTLTCPPCSGHDVIVSMEPANEALVTVTHMEPQKVPVRDGNVYEVSYNITGRFLGKTVLIAHIELVNYIGEVIGDYEVKHPVEIFRPRDPLDVVFDYLTQVFLVLSTCTFGCELDLGLLKGYMRRPLGISIGLICQFGLMPTIALLSDIIFDLPEFIDYGLLAYASCPGGGTSNVYTKLLGGDINLSITMTFASTIASIGMLPLWMYTAGKTLSGGNTEIPFTNIVTSLALLIIPCFVGVFLRRFFPRFTVLLVKFVRPVAMVMVLVCVFAGFYINRFIFELIADEGVLMALPPICLPLIGFMVSMSVAFIARQPWKRIKTIAIETGVQNVTLCIVLLRQSLPSPASHLSAVSPVLAGLATPIPILIAYVIRRIMIRMYGDDEDSDEKETPQEDIVELDDDHNEKKMITDADINEEAESITGRKRAWSNLSTVSLEVEGKNDDADITREMSWDSLPYIRESTQDSRSHSDSMASDSGVGSIHPAGLEIDDIIEAPTQIPIHTSNIKPNSKSKHNSLTGFIKKKVFRNRMYDFHERRERSHSQPVDINDELGSPHVTAPQVVRGRSYSATAEPTLVVRGRSSTIA